MLSSLPSHIAYYIYTASSFLLNWKFYQKVTKILNLSCLGETVLCLESVKYIKREKKNSNKLKINLDELPYSNPKNIHMHNVKLCSTKHQEN